jgi:hypothetical protein
MLREGGVVVEVNFCGRDGSAPSPYPLMHPIWRTMAGAERSGGAGKTFWVWVWDDAVLRGSCIDGLAWERGGLGELVRR